VAKVYARKNGLPSGSGTIYDPFNDLSLAVSALSSGDTLDIGPGTFFPSYLDFSVLNNVTVISCVDSFLNVGYLYTSPEKNILFKGGNWNVTNISVPVPSIVVTSPLPSAEILADSVVPLLYTSIGAAQIDVFYTVNGGAEVSFDSGVSVSGSYSFDTSTLGLVAADDLVIIIKDVAQPLTSGSVALVVSGEFTVLGYIDGEYLVSIMNSKLIMD